MVSVLQTILSLTHQIYPELWLNGVRNGLKSLISPFKFSALVSAKAFFMQRSYVCAATELQVSKIFSSQWDNGGMMQRISHSSRRIWSKCLVFDTNG